MPSFRWWPRTTSTAAILATIFLNFNFWQMDGKNFWPHPPASLYAGLLAVCILVFTALFFLAPALAAQSLERPLFANSFGSIPAVGLRVCSLFFLIDWISDSVAIPGLGWVHSIFRREIADAELAVIAAGLVAFVFVTGLQNEQTSARMAFFSNKLAIAILIAAFCRVHQGWSTAWNGWVQQNRSLTSDIWSGVSQLTLHVAPLGLLAANLYRRTRDRKQVIHIALVGFALPLIGVLWLVGLIDVATLGSPYYRHGLNATVSMALWGNAANSALPGRMLLVLFTMFGVMRFGVQALADLLPERSGRRAYRLMLGGLALVIVWFSLDTVYILAPLAVLSTVGLLGASAVITVDYLTRGWRVEQARRVDWVAVSALVAAMACTPWMSPEPDMGTWSLPAYAAGFFVCLSGRLISYRRRRPQRPSARLVDPA